MVRITKDKRHDILKDGICIGQIYLARAESRKLRYWAISCMSGIGFNTFNEALPADGLSIEEAFELAITAKKWADGDRFYRSINDGEPEEL